MKLQLGIGKDENVYSDLFLKRTISTCKRWTCRWQTSKGHQILGRHF